MSPNKSKDRNLADKKKQMNRRLRVLIVSGHALWRAGLRCLLDNSDAGVVVIGEAARGSDAVRQVTGLRPDVLILDLALYKSDGLELLRRIRRIENVHKVIVTAPQIQKQDLARALQLGVKGVVLKRSPLEELIRCIQWIAADGTCIQQNDNWSVRTPSPFKVPAKRSRQGQRFCITHREMEIVEAVVAGYTNKEIARRLRVSVDTVRHHVTNIFNKTGASNRLELVLFAIEKKLVDSTQLVIGRTAVEASLQGKQSA